MTCNTLKKSIKYLKGLSLKKAYLFNTELNLYTYEDLLFFYPKGYMHIYTLNNISELSNNNNNNNDFVQILGKITKIEEINYKNKKGKMLIACLEDKTGFIELIWFRKNNFIKNITKNITVIVSGRIKYFQKKIQIVHPNIKEFQSSSSIKNHSIFPVYSIPINLKKKGINNSFMIHLLQNLLKELKNDINEFFFQDFINNKKLMSRKKALIQIHFPESLDSLSQAQHSLKFEELFILKLFFLYKKKVSHSYPFTKLGKNFHFFYKYFLPFSLTIEQKKVFKEIWNDLKKPIQMNRLLQGEVGCGKTIIAILSMLVALDNGFQSCLMAPTEVLAIQHYYSIKKMFSKIGIKIALLTSSISDSIRKSIYHEILTGKISIIIGTHSLIQEKVQFQNLGLAIIDEEQRFGVEQREKIWKKDNKPPHILIMTATPIPRTLAKIIYHDLNISIIRKLPLGRKPIKTIHFWNKNRDQAFQIVKDQISIGRQVYIIYPTINTSFKYKNLIKGHQEIREKFKNLENKIGILHGEMNFQEKNIQINRFLRGETKILIATTVIEVGVNVPNASVIIIENADFFGLSQLHQLRGRVGRGIHQSYCILITDKKISVEGFFRIKKMCETNKGLEIAKEDLKLRGGGDLIGTKQSGKNYFRIVNLIKDYKLIKEVFPIAKIFFKKNPNFLNNTKNIFYEYYRNKWKIFK
ncbi:ATP-dependent DNA helicase RecG [Blattabacterium sp. (Blaberus giganteus)]|uniref:ATP-dependent DNA helicase RecG n=1 Tax=Blattabacterium sp. (Blaberus giganteus) TaxID=1186051 RepID=UPI00025F6FEE|nr:ATP-dependent DNA helicase RecG [Blattabacterium sp. (Blaberus giganteus)]AFJ90916.1 ATP-dependent DNA helicase RecG [Blattabacterium sp. (Blaberus giganteus)]